MADIYIHYGTDIQAMVRELLAVSKATDHLESNAKIVLKPNLVVSRPADGGATTHPEIAEGVIQYLRGCGCNNISIAEGSWVGDSTSRAFQHCGYQALADQYGVPLVNTKQEPAAACSYQGYGMQVCNIIAEADFLINLPVLKGHCQTGMTCCLKNLKGCIPDSEKRRFHSTGLHKPIAALNTVIKPHLHIIDSICGDLTFEEGGNPVQSNRILLGHDPVLLDSYCAQLMGYHPDEIDHLRYAKEYGVGRYAATDSEIVELNTENRPKTNPPRSGVARRLASHIDEDGACSACYAALIFALNKTGGWRGGSIKIGQGFRGKTCNGLGVGNCTGGCAAHVKGCPPKAVDIVDFLQHNT